ncbi:DNA alkylation repair protein [Kribbella deserti]|uniref:DNA alkylation repair protein n=1 Tax=Kribbella deserti TaxID=1926257 RepID=A0ABV6QU18_9ACTN
MPTAEEMLSTPAVAALGEILAAPTVAAVDLRGATFSERGRLVRDALLTDLPGEYDEFDRAIRKALADDAFTGWMIWPVTEALAVRAVDANALDAGLALLAELTGRLTGEFALRTFLAADVDRTLATALEWTTHPDEHVRRLATEGTRSRLPWARQVPALLEKPRTLAILDALRSDSSAYVRRSVANHLNDLSRDHPTAAVSLASRWAEPGDERSGWIIRHGLRTLVKKGDPGALGLLGFAPPVGVEVIGPTLSKSEIDFGGELTFEATVTNTSAEPVRLAVDYVIHHQKANGKLAPKVFKLTVRELLPGASAVLQKRHSFRPISTRRYYPGPHAVELQVNGRPTEPTPFTLLP